MNVVLMCFDDYYGLYVDDKLVYQGNELSDKYSLLEYAERFDFSYSDVRSVDIMDMGPMEDYVRLTGGFPDLLWDFPKYPHFKHSS